MPTILFRLLVIFVCSWSFSSANARVRTFCVPQALSRLIEKVLPRKAPALAAREIPTDAVNQLSLSSKSLRELGAARNYYLSTLQSRRPKIPQTLRIGAVDYNVVTYLGSGVEADTFLVHRLDNDYVIKKFRSASQFEANTQALSRYSHLTEDLLMPISEHPSEQALLYPSIHGLSILAVEMNENSPREARMSTDTRNYILKTYEAFAKNNALHPIRSNVLVDFETGRLVIIDPH